MAAVEVPSDADRDLVWFVFQAGPRDSDDLDARHRQLLLALTVCLEGAS
jgi:hypothetical protein